MKRVSRSATGDRSGLSSERILQVAVATADRSGLSAVSMRGLARELGVTPMALYWHFADKDALLDAMAEQVVEEAHFADDPEAAWQERYRHVLVTLVELLHTHPWMGRLIIERLVPLPNYLNALEILLDALRQAGLTTRDGAVLVQQSVQTVVSLVEYEPRPKPDGDDDGECEDRDKLAALPADDFPNVRAAALPLSTPESPEEYYRLGLDTIVGGIVSIAQAAVSR